MKDGSDLREVDDSKVATARSRVPQIPFNLAKLSISEDILFICRVPVEGDKAERFSGM